jgi:hypothetical protein
MNVLVQQFATLLSDEKVWTVRWPDVRVSSLRILRQYGSGCVVHRDKA